MKRKKKSSSKKEEKNTQLDLSIKEPFKNKFFKVKGKANSLLSQLEVRKFLKDTFFWFAVIISLIMVCYQIYLIWRNIDNLPSYLPILKYNIASSAKLTPKIFLISFPVISSLPLLASIFLTAKKYNKEKFLTKLLLLCTLLCSISLTIALIQLINSF